MTKLPLSFVLIGTLVSALILFATRVFPFILFSRKEPPSIICFIEKYIPPMVMAILVVYCLKDIDLTSSPFGIAHFLAIAVTAALHIWKNNPMISIFGGTILFMVLQRIL